MRAFHPLSLLALAVAIVPPAVLAVPSSASDNRLPLAVARPAAREPVHKPHSVFPQLTWLRDTVIRTVFRLPANEAGQVDGPTSRPRPSTSQLPATLLAKYGGDVVLRFNISTEEEEAALSEAADTLFLDVWEFSHNWADIRLRDDDVC